MSKFLQTIVNVAAVVCCLSVLFAPEHAVAKKVAKVAAAQHGLADGLYKVTASVPDGQSGVGIIVISGGTVNGGDMVYTYQGRINQAGGELKATITVVRHSPGGSILGPLDNFQIDLKGTIQNNGKAFIASGAVVGRPELRTTLSGSQVSTLISPLVPDGK